MKLFPELSLESFVVIALAYQFLCVFFNHSPVVHPLLCCHVLQPIFVLLDWRVHSLIKPTHVGFFFNIHHAQQLLPYTQIPAQIFGGAVITKWSIDRVVELVHQLERNLAPYFGIKRLDIVEGCIHKVLVNNSTISFFGGYVCKVVHDHADEQIQHHVLSQDKHQREEENCAPSAAVGRNNNCTITVKNIGSTIGLLNGAIIPERGKILPEHQLKDGVKG